MLDAISLASDVQPLLPLRIIEVGFHFGMLTVIGDRWALNLTGDWSWRRGVAIVTDFAQPAAEDAVWDLCGLRLVDVRFPDPAFDGDCEFVLSDGSLHVQSDRSGWETWVFRHDDLDTVFVGL